VFLSSDGTVKEQYCKEHSCKPLEVYQQKLVQETRLEIVKKLKLGESPSKIVRMKFYVF